VAGYLGLEEEDKGKHLLTVGINHRDATIHLKMQSFLNQLV